VAWETYVTNRAHKAQLAKNIAAEHAAAHTPVAVRNEPLTAFPAGSLPALMRHAQQQIDQHAEKAGMRLPHLIGYFLLVALEHAEGVRPSAALLRERSSTTRKGLSLPLCFLKDIGLLEQGTFLNDRSYTETFYQVSRKALAIAERGRHLKT
jgi:hypothetical protein